MRRAVGLNHVAEREHLRAPPVGLCVAPRHPSRCRALPVGTWCAARRPESHRAGQSEVTSPPCAVVVGQPMRCRPVVASRTASLGTLSTIYIVISIREKVNTPQSLFCTICPVSPVPPQLKRLECASAALSPRYRLAPTRGAVLPSLAGRLATLPVGLEPAHGPCLPPAGRVMRGRFPGLPLAARVAPFDAHTSIVSSPPRRDDPAGGAVRRRGRRLLDLPAMPVPQSAGGRLAAVSPARARPPGDRDPPDPILIGARRPPAGSPLPLRSTARRSAPDQHSNGAQGAARAQARSPWPARHRSAGSQTHHQQPGGAPIRPDRPPSRPHHPHAGAFCLVHVPMTRPLPAHRPRPGDRQAAGRSSSARTAPISPRVPRPPPPGPLHARARGERLAAVSAPATSGEMPRGPVFGVGGR